jgi:hypothetical protein
VGFAGVFQAGQALHLVNERRDFTPSLRAWRFEIRGQITVNSQHFVG